jgi:hypothetical protein
MPSLLIREAIDPGECHRQCAFERWVTSYLIEEPKNPIRREIGVPSIRKSPECKMDDCPNRSADREGNPIHGIPMPSHLIPPLLAGLWLPIPRTCSSMPRRSATRDALLPFKSSAQRGYLLRLDAFLRPVSPACVPFLLQHQKREYAQYPHSNSKRPAGI